MDGTEIATSTEDSSKSEQPEVLSLIMQVLQRHASFRLEALRIFAAILQTVLSEPSVVHDTQCQQSLTAMLRSAQRNSAYHVMHVLENSAVEDQVLDIFNEEWEVSKAPPVNVTQVLNDPRHCFPYNKTLQRSEGTGSSDSISRKAIRSFLTLRSLLIGFLGLVRQSPAQTDDQGRSAEPAALVSQEPSPLQVDDDGYKEGSSFEIGDLERIICSIVAPDGKSTRVHAAE